MPLIDLAPTPLDTPFVGVPETATADQQSAAEQVRPEFSQTLGAAFRQNNLVGSFFSNKDMGAPEDVDLNFDAWGAIKGTPYEQYWDRFVDVHNPKAMGMRKAQIDMEAKDRQTLAASGWVGTLSDIGATVLDPTILLPVAGTVSKARGGISVARSALAAGASIAGITAAQEAGLHATQQLRTPEESAWAIGSSALLGTFIGGGAAAFLSRAEQKAATDALDRLRTQGSSINPTAEEAAGGAPRQAVSGGAAAAETATREDLTVAGRAARAVAESTDFLNPNLRLNASPSVAARRIGQQLAENTLFQNMHAEGETLGPAAETLMRTMMNGRLADAVSAHNQIFSAGRKANFGMTRPEFEDAVGEAMRRGDVGQNDFVTQAAQSWRQKLFDPFKDEAIAEKLLPSDVSVDTAESYFRRLYNQQRLTAREGEFKQIVRDWADAEVKRVAAAFDKETSDLLAKAKPAEVAALKGERGALRAEKFGNAGEDYAGEIADAVYSKLTGRGFDNNLPDHLVPTTRGPLKERTFHIPDALIEPFLESNVIHVGHEYARKMAAEIELTRRFGSADMAEQLRKIADEYTAIRKQVSDAKDIQTMRAISDRDPGAVKWLAEQVKKPDLEKTREGLLAYLGKSEKQDVQDVEAMRDLLRGTYKKASMRSIWGRIAHGVLAYNYITRLGGVILANVSEIFRPAMVYGMKSLMTEGFAPLLSGAKRAAAGMAINEAKLAGQVVERVLQHRLSSYAELGDPYRAGSAMERLLDQGSRIATRWNFLTVWTDGMKAVTSILAQNRILRAVRDGGDDRMLAYLGIDANVRARIADQFAKHGEEIDGVHVANTEKWTDPLAVRTYRAAMSKDIDSVIVTKSVGDVPLFANTPTGKLITQFKAFALASHQRVLLRGLQENQARFVGGMIAMTAIGMLATYLRALSANRVDKVSIDPQTGAFNPGWWIGEGLDQTGIFSVPMEFSNIVEKFSGVNPIKSPLRNAGAFLTGTNKGPPTLRYGSRGDIGTLMGPGIGMADDAITVLKTLAAPATGSDVQKAQRRAAVDAAFRQVPYYSYPGMRTAIEWLVKPGAYSAVGASQ